MEKAHGGLQMTTAENYRQGKTNTFLFPSVFAIGAAAAEIKSPRRAGGSRGWTGETWQESLDFAQTGDTSRVPAAEELLAKILDRIDIGTLRPTWEKDVCGAFPNVADYLANDPECMRQKVMQQSNTEPVRVMVCTTSSCSITKEELNARGCAVLAFVMALQLTRPVSLATFTALDGDARGDTILVTEQQPSPICLSEACYALTSAGFDRNITHELGYILTGYRGGWAKRIDPLLYDDGENRKPTSAAYKLLCAQMGMTGRQDLLVPPALSNDQCITDPIGWILARLEDFKEREFSE